MSRNDLSVYMLPWNEASEIYVVFMTKAIHLSNGEMGNYKYIQISTSFYLFMIFFCVSQKKMNIFSHMHEWGNQTIWSGFSMFLLYFAHHYFWTSVFIILFSLFLIYQCHTVMSLLEGNNRNISWTGLWILFFVCRLSKIGVRHLRPAESSYLISSKNIN